MVRFWNTNGSSVTTLMIVLGIGAIAAQGQAAQWSTPVRPPDGCRSTPSGAPSLALNATGAWVIAAYAQTGSGLEAFTVSACTSNDGVNWSGPITIGQGTSPAVVIAPDGHAVAVWQGGPATSPNIQASMRPAGGRWSVPVVVSTIAGHPLLGMDGAGNTIAVWAGTTLATPVATASLPVGGNWTTPKTLVAQGGGIGLTTNSMGGVIIGWKAHSGQVQAVSGTVLGGFGAPVTLGSASRNGLPAVQIALNHAGAASFAWQANSSSNSVVTRSPGGSWSGVTQLPGPNVAGIGTAIDGAGNAITAFAVIQATGTLTYASRRPAGGTWGTPTLLSAPNDKGGVRVAGDDAGTFVVIWNDAAGHVEAVTVPSGGGFSPGVPVGESPSSRLLVPGKAVLWTAAGISIEPV
jgi:hypothetical protein